MKVYKKILIVFGIILVAAMVSAQPLHIYPEPVIHQTDFLMVDGIDEFNVEFALDMTNRYACIFVNPFDGVFLHVEVDGNILDILIISDVGMNRLTIWQCKNLVPGAKRSLELISAYKCEDGGGLRAPSGMDTNAKNRLFDPANDVIYVADRGNGRIVELAYQPDSEGGKLKFNRSIGEGYLQYPMDVAISAYGDGIQENVELYIVDVGTFNNDGSLSKFGIDGSFRGSWHEIGWSANQDLVEVLHNPVSVACFPDTIVGKTAIFITEEVNHPLLYLTSGPGGTPDFASIWGMDHGQDFARVGGIACDDYGRVYAANSATGKIEIFEPSIMIPYEPFGELGEEPGQLNYPTNIVIDTYHGVAEALVFEFYYRFSGLQSYIIEGGCSSKKPVTGFKANGLIDPELFGTAPVAESFVLYDAYPNPFNARCQISFSIPNQSHVTIEMYNLLGQKVATPLNETKPAGDHSIVFDAKGLSSGIYFYRVTADGYTQSKKIVLLK
ncbi:MAG: T9SS type A sorting domain-containing protein [candidate division Zixibacteria bacterium]|nr:T9SS type A sorting domain-containing protein [candidate division Zixibacteria bacterium]